MASKAVADVPLIERGNDDSPGTGGAGDVKRGDLPPGYGRVFAFAATVPIVSIYVVLIAIPAVLAILLSLTEWHAIGFPQWVGFANWVHFFTDPRAMNALFGT